MTRLCRFCHSPLTQTLVDLGQTPLANGYLPDDPAAISAERSFPLHVMVCNACWLAQTTETVPADAIFTHDYAYLSSYSAGWVAHARHYAEAMTARFALGPQSRVVEVASNDGYLLQHFVAMGVPVLGWNPRVTLRKWQKRSVSRPVSCSLTKPRPLHCAPKDLPPI